MEKKMKRTGYLVALLIIIFSVRPAISQEIQASVYCNVEQVPPVNKDYLQDFDKVIESYINNYRWSGKNYGEDKIKVSIQILFVSASANNYNAKVVFQSVRPIWEGDKKTERVTKMIQILDDKFEFYYQKNQAMNHEELKFDALQSFFDFYMIIILGYDSDTYEKEAGTQFFERAQTICQMAAGNGTVSGWKKATGGGYTRWDFIEELLSPKYTSVRRAFFDYHYNGLDCKGTSPKEAYQSALGALQEIGKVKDITNSQSIIIKNFFDLKYQEIADFFKDYEDKSVYLDLIKVDGAHFKTYDDYMKGKE
jgi:hypothetical protein